GLPDMEITGLTWGITCVVIVGLIVFDYYAHVKKAHTPTLKESGIWSAIYLAIALAFGLVFFAFGDTDHAVEYYAGFITEKALSIDNLFVFMIIMTSFNVPRKFQQKVLLFGITFALISRTVFILLEQPSWNGGLMRSISSGSSCSSWPANSSNQSFPRPKKLAQKQIISWSVLLRKSCRLLT